MKRIRVILADDHTLMLDAIKNLLEPEFEVVGTFVDGHALVEAAPKLRADIIILDIGMPTMNGLNAGQRLRKILPAARLIFLTMNLDPDLASEAFRLGASGYLVKTDAASELVKAIREVLCGRIHVTPLLSKDVVGSVVNNLKSRKSIRRLTLRQKEVLQLLAEGRSMKEAAFILKVTPRTVAFHKYTMMEQLRVTSNAELLQYAMNSSVMAARG